MKLRTKEEIIEVLKNAVPISGFISMPWGVSSFDHRDIRRLLLFLNYDEMKSIFGNVITEDRDWNAILPWNEETVTKYIKSSLKFAFEKAFGRRGISAPLMHGVMRMWMWIVQDDELVGGDPNYDDYGLAYLYKIRDKYFPEMEPQE